MAQVSELTLPVYLLSLPKGTPTLLVQVQVHVRVQVPVPTFVPVSDPILPIHAVVKECSEKNLAESKRPKIATCSDPPCTTFPNYGLSACEVHE